MAVKKPKYSLWTAVYDPNWKGPLGRATPEQLKKLEKAVLEIDWEAERKACKHETAWKSTRIITRGIWGISHDYFCISCGLKSKLPMGQYRNQPTTPNELENILYAPLD